MRGAVWFVDLTSKGRGEKKRDLSSSNTDLSLVYFFSLLDIAWGETFYT
jgi:hypothetical protein